MIFVLHAEMGGRGKERRGGEGRAGEGKRGEEEIERRRG